MHSALLIPSKTICGVSQAPSIKNKFHSCQCCLIKISQHVQIKPGRTWIRMRVSLASLPTLETIHFDIWSQPSNPGAVVWSERDGISNTGSPSVIVLWRCATVHQCTGERSTSLWASAKALWTLSSTCYCSEVQHYKSAIASPNAPESSLNSNSIRLLLCMFVSFRSHLAITGANLWSAPGYSVKMTDLSHLPPPNSPTTTSSNPLVAWLSLPQVSLLLLAHGCHKFDFLMKNQCFECLPRLSAFKGKIV